MFENNEKHRLYGIKRVRAQSFRVLRGCNVQIKSLYTYLRFPFTELLVTLI